MSKSQLKLTIGLLTACLFPSLLTWVYFVGLDQSATTLQQGVYSLGKILQFTFPLWFLAWVMKSRIRAPFGKDKTLGVGILFGLGVGVLIWSLVQSPFFSAETLTQLQGSIQDKVEGLGFKNWQLYLTVALFYSLVHSFLEEYYWRFFVYGNLRKIMAIKAANALSSMAFMAHHVIVLAMLLGWKSPWTYLLSGAIALGGSFWAWQFERSGSLKGAWLSHLLVDAAIFYIGFQWIVL